MHNTLLIKAFEKAKEEVNSVNVYPRAQVLSDYILEDSKEPYGAKILSIKYKSAISTPSIPITIKNHATISLSRYLGYSDYSDFVKHNLDQNNEINTQGDSTTYILDRKKSVITALIILTIVIGVLIYNYVNRQRFMIWNEDHYIEVNLDANKYSLNQLKFYKEERIINFKKIKPKCEDTLFNRDGSVKIWYGKNAQKKLEYFTSLGLHPETGKSLKPITQYMIDKYICN
ncbi:hypothetical protein HNV08_07190 [Winogradskyella eckloniae]|uniref:hypothetical protein n=1 Tax=Winogradskyella eckloniae TaxID=1089306 RepID=UPI001565B482|nr:hypothetical protein [Winogradskyella eckloniae]NRD19830.1 hypothetical protein [Winogradskyella eckloniae]